MVTDYAFDGTTTAALGEGGICRKNTIANHAYSPHAMLQHHGKDIDQGAGLADRENARNAALNLGP